MVSLLAMIDLVVLPVLYVRDARLERQRRGEFFAEALQLFDKYRVTQDGQQYPVLEAQYRGMRVKLEPVLDDLAWRKLPSLWLKATLLVSNPRRGVLDFLVRPQGIEVYSPNDGLRRLPVPQGWPQHALLCTDDRRTMPSLDRLGPHMTAFEDPKTKELLITPHGIRFVYQAAQAARAEYLVLRQSRFAQTKVDPELVRALLDRAIAIAADLDETEALQAEAA